MWVMDICPRCERLVVHRWAHGDTFACVVVNEPESPYTTELPDAAIKLLMGGPVPDTPAELL